MNKQAIQDAIVHLTLDPNAWSKEIKVPTASMTMDAILGNEKNKYHEQAKLYSMAIDMLGDDNTDEHVQYQYITSAGAVACSFLTMEDARKWKRDYNEKLARGLTMPSVKLYRKVTTTVMEEIHI